MANLKKEAAMPIPVALDADFISELDRVAQQLHETRSGIMRKAMRAGLEVLEHGKGEPLALDGELSENVGQVASTFKLTRQRVLLEALRIGTSALFSRLHRRAARRGEGMNPEEAAQLFETLAHYDDDLHPIAREHGWALAEIASLDKLLADLQRHAPGAHARVEAMRKLQALRAKVWGHSAVFPFGMSNEEIAKQTKDLESQLPAGTTFSDAPPGPLWQPDQPNWAGAVKLGSEAPATKTAKPARRAPAKKKRTP